MPPLHPGAPPQQLQFAPFQILQKHLVLRVHLADLLADDCAQPEVEGVAGGGIVVAEFLAGDALGPVQHRLRTDAAAEMFVEPQADRTAKLLAVPAEEILEDARLPAGGEFPRRRFVRLELAVAGMRK